MGGERKKRGQGRPGAGTSEVGRDALVEATWRLLQTETPARVTMSRVAREAEVDPALVRYYFGDRTQLLLAVIHRMRHDLPRDVAIDEPVLQSLADHIAGTFRFTRSAKHMHRLMIDELAEHPGSAAWLREINAGAIAFYRELLERDGGEQLRATDPLFVHLALIGIADFFVSARPVIESLVPEGTDFDALQARYEAFVTSLVLDGLRRR